MTENHLIIGGGFLGQILAKKLKANVCITRRHADASVSKTLCVDVNNAKTWQDLQGIPTTKPLNIYCLVPPSKIELDRFSEFLRCLQYYQISKAILVSSTVVYGQESRTVDADSDVLLDSVRAEKQYAIEEVWRTYFKAKASIVRLAGLYGANRVIGKKSLLAGQAIAGNPDGYLNLIHVEDAANLLRTITHLEKPAAIELGCDDSPVLRSDYYGTLAELLGVNAPRFETAKARGGNRICSNELTRQRTGWQPQYANSLKAIKDLI